jgi:hypothetical protein
MRRGSWRAHTFGRLAGTQATDLGAPRGYAPGTR